MWNADKTITHTRLVELSKDTNKVLALAAGSRSAEELVEESRPLALFQGRHVRFADSLHLIG